MTSIAIATPSRLDPATLDPGDPLRRGLAFALVAAGLTALLVCADPRTLDGEAVWLKPLKFQLSLALLAATLIWATHLVPAPARRSRWVRWTGTAIALTLTYEIAFLSLQAGRGVRSHFNDTTLFDEIGATIMAAGAGVLVTGTALLGAVLLIQSVRARSLTPLHLAMGLGLILGGALGAWAGGSLGANGGPFVGAATPDEATVPLFGWSLTRGDLRISHFLGLHAMQIVPAIALLARPLSRRAQYTTVILGAAALTALTLHTNAVALAGDVPFGL